MADGLFCLFTFTVVACVIALSWKLLDDLKGEAEYQTIRRIAGIEEGEKVMGPGGTDPGYGIQLPDIQEDILKSINPAYTAWLYIPDTEVNYPVVLSQDNQDYLKKTFEGNDNANGTLFFDCSNPPFSSLNTVIHGHNMKSGKMFGQLDGYLSYDFLNSHPLVYVFHQGIWSVYHIFAVYQADNQKTDPYRYLFSSRDAFAEFVKHCQQNSIYKASDKGTDVEEILTLSTCYGKNKKLIVQAALLPQDTPYRSREVTE